MRTIALSTATVILSLSGFAQTQSPEKKFKFGFNVGVDYPKSQFKTDPATIQQLQTSNGTGLRLGILMDYAFTSHFVISPKAELAFNNSNVSITGKDGSKETYELYPTIELASHFIYKIPNEKLEPYLLFGPKYKIPLADKKTNSALFIKSPTVALDFGIGANKPFTYLTVAPEIRYSLGLTNISNIDAVKSLYYHTVSLVFNFK